MLLNIPQQHTTVTCCISMLQRKHCKWTLLLKCYAINTWFIDPLDCSVIVPCDFQERVLIEAYKKCLCALSHCHGGLSDGEQPISLSLAGHSVDTFRYQVSQEKVSIHLPVCRLLAGKHRCAEWTSVWSAVDVHVNLCCMSSPFRAPCSAQQNEGGVSVPWAAAVGQYYDQLLSNQVIDNWWSDMKRVGRSYLITSMMNVNMINGLIDQF